MKWGVVPYPVPPNIYLQWEDYFPMCVHPHLGFTLLKNKNKLINCHCGAIFSSDNCQIRSKACQPLNSKIKKLMKIERNQPWKLDSQQKKKLRRFYNSSSKIVYKCLICKKTTSFSGSKTNRSSRSKISTTSTPIPKLKLNNKNDANAGLFITTHY